VVKPVECVVEEKEDEEVVRMRLRSGLASGAGGLITGGNCRGSSGGDDGVCVNSRGGCGWS